MERYKIIFNEEISKDIFLLKLEGKIHSVAGRFSMLEVGEGTDPLLLRPLSISDYDEESFSFLYQIKGRGTDFLSRKREGDYIGILNDLGNGYDIPERGKIALVCGGLGIAPMPLLAKQIGRKDDIDLLAGFRNKSYYIDKIAPYVSDIRIATEDGSEGSRGFVTEVLNPEKYDFILTCGPMPMMNAVYEKAKGITKVFASFESRMACGVGACLGCVVKTKDGMKRVCKDGPVFPCEVII